MQKGQVRINSSLARFPFQGKLSPKVTDEVLSRSSCFISH